MALSAGLVSQSACKCASHALEVSSWPFTQVLISDLLGLQSAPCAQEVSSWSSTQAWHIIVSIFIEYLGAADLLVVVAVPHGTILTVTDTTMPHKICSHSSLTVTCTTTRPKSALTVTGTIIAPEIS